ncbi:MAG: hypothetical protein EKK64_10790 [Neisseriaceae bacterium]|nr:MAG: hypothetical protein EKK64_10790 [Neisseriaceae bacterium]
MIDLKSKVRGCFLGVAIGDAIGKAVEIWTHEQIKEKFGLITDYQDCKNNKYFPDDVKGTTTDDWQLTKAIIKSIIKEGNLDVDEVARQHVEEYKKTFNGWGNSTKEAIASLIEGKHWKESACSSSPNRGLGNGVAMKISPVGVLIGVKYFLSLNENNSFPYDKEEILNKVIDICGMTHYTNIALSSAFCQTTACMACLSYLPEVFNKQYFLKLMIKISTTIENSNLFHKTEDMLSNRFNLIEFDMTTEKIIESFGKGSCYVYDSLPFSYAFFLNNPLSIESLYNCVSAGGDTDTNGSMVGALLGALNGEQIFPEHLLNGLVNKEEVLTLADQFYEKLTNGVEIFVEPKS